MNDIVLVSKELQVSFGSRVCPSKSMNYLNHSIWKSEGPLLTMIIRPGPVSRLNHLELPRQADVAGYFDGKAEVWSQTGKCGEGRSFSIRCSGVFGMAIWGHKTTLPLYIIAHGDMLEWYHSGLKSM